MQFNHFLIIRLWEFSVAIASKKKKKEKKKKKKKKEKKKKQIGRPLGLSIALTHVTFVPY